MAVSEVLDRRGGRQCETCYWFSNTTQEQRQRGCSNDGWCEFKHPPIVMRASGSNPTRIAEATKEWCSCWLPNMAHPNL